MLINFRNGMMGGKRLPYDAEVEYLQSDGNSRINAPVALSSTNLAVGVTIKMTLDVPTAGNNRGLLAQGPGTYSTPWCVCTTATAGEIRIYSAGKFQSLFSGLSGPTDITVEVNSTTVYLDIGGTRKGGTYSTSYQYSDNLAILGYDGYNASSSATYPAPSGTRLYAYKMYVGNNLVADCIPVRKGTTGYLYDRVSGKLFGNAGTGDFVIGPDVVPVEYIESHGTEWIDTGFKANTTTTRLDCGIVPLNTSTSQGLCGSRNTVNLADDGAANIFVINGNLRCDWLNGFQGGAQTYAISSGSDYDVSITRGTAVINGTTLTSTNDASITESVNFLIGNFNNGTAGPFNTGFIGRWKLAKLFSNGAIVRSFLPVRVGTEGAMMDTLTRRIYRNAGTGAFAYGADLPYPIGG